MTVLPPPPTIERCYRHPDRETGRRCTRCGKPACGDCLVQVSVGSHCVDCVKAARPDVKTRAKFWNARQPTLVTYVAHRHQRRRLPVDGLQRPQRVPRIALAEPFIQNGEYYRLITSGFLHFSIFHIGMNMLLLFQLGQLLEPAIGRVRFALVYFAALLAGSLRRADAAAQRSHRRRFGRGLRVDGCCGDRSAPTWRQRLPDRDRHGPDPQPGASRSRFRASRSAATSVARSPAHLRLRHAGPAVQDAAEVGVVRGADRRDGRLRDRQPGSFPASGRRVSAVATEPQLGDVQLCDSVARPLGRAAPPSARRAGPAPRRS